MIAVFGNGMIGTALARMIAGDVEFMDSRLGNIDEVLSRQPECVVLGVLDGPRQKEMRDHLAKSGYTGPVLTYPPVFDIRLATMRLLAPTLPEGAVAELGVYKGDFAVEIQKAFPGREMHLFDSFEGFDGLFTDTSEETVARRLPMAHIHKGFFPSTFEEHTYAFLSLDADLYEPTKAGLDLFYPCMAGGGVIMVHDYNSRQFPGVKEAVDNFCEQEGLFPVPVADLHGSVLIIKPGASPGL